jgi:hypothetical protein
VSINELHPDFYTSFNSEVEQLLIAALKKASDSACELHDESRGSNNRTYGFQIYEFLKHEFKKISVSSSGKIEIIQKGNWVGLKVGRFEVGFYKVGYSENENIDRCFPKNKCGAPKLVQMELFDHLPKDAGPDLQRVTKFILAHQSNSLDGVCSIHLCVPMKDEESETIDNWAHKHQIYMIDRQATTPTTPDEFVSDERPLPEKINDFQLRKKLKKRENQLDG